MASDVELRPGERMIVLEFTRAAQGRGTATLCIDGRAARSVEIERLSPSLMVSFGDEGLCCGYDSDLPVGDYVAPFRFTGTISHVVVEVEERVPVVRGDSPVLRTQRTGLKWNSSRTSRAWPSGPTSA